MGYDAELADRVRGLMEREPDRSEKAMFGGLAFLVGGAMALAANSHARLMVRVEPDQLGPLLARAHVSPMVMRGRELAGWLEVEPGGLADDDELAEWVDRGVAAARASR